MPDRDRDRSIVAEFTRQAASMEAAPAFHAEEGLARIAHAVSASRAQTALDLACGPGIVAESIAPLVGELVGVDATLRMVERAEARCRAAGHRNCRFLVSRAEELPLGDGSADVVVSRLALHHFADAPAVLAEVRRVLRAGGRIVIADIVSSDVPEESALHNALEKLRDPTHVRMRSERELTTLVASAGFEMLHRESWQQRRHFAEWAAIIADAERTEPIRHVMAALARAGVRAGIALEERDDALRFTHEWRLLVARRLESAAGVAGAP